MLRTGRSVKVAEGAGVSLSVLSEEFEKKHDDVTRLCIRGNSITVKQREPVATHWRELYLTGECKEEVIDFDCLPLLERLVVDRVTGTEGVLNALWHTIGSKLRIQALKVCFHSDSPPTYLQCLQLLSGSGRRSIEITDDSTYAPASCELSNEWSLICEGIHLLKLKHLRLESHIASTAFCSLFGDLSTPLHTYPERLYWFYYTVPDVCYSRPDPNPERRGVVQDLFMSRFKVMAERLFPRCCVLSLGLGEESEHTDFYDLVWEVLMETQIQDTTLYLSPVRRTDLKVWIRRFETLRDRLGEGWILTHRRIIGCPGRSFKLHNPSSSVIYTFHLFEYTVNQPFIEDIDPSLPPESYHPVTDVTHPIRD